MIRNGLKAVSFFTPTTLVEQTYNIQGWLTDQSSNKFTMKLEYFNTGKYAGNITKWSWGHGSTTSHYYDLSYDTFGRLRSGIHSGGNHETIGGYDLNGNIQRLTRTGSTAADFTYAYIGNQLTSLNNGSSYAYDQNGNMTIDPRKNLTFSYNSLNLVQEVKSGSTVRAKYQYAADGTKLKVQDSGNTSSYDYLGSVTLIKDGSGTNPEVAFAEGIIRGSNILFFEKDHLGSVRTVMNTTGGAPQYLEYYPFGTQYTGQIDNVNRYRFNGKEVQLTGGLDLIDFNTRMYDPEIGRFHKMDLLSELFAGQSPFVYANNNPVRYIDFMGMNAQSPDSTGIAPFPALTPPVEGGDIDAVVVVGKRSNRNPVDYVSIPFAFVEEELNILNEANQFWMPTQGGTMIYSKNLVMSSRSSLARTNFYKNTIPGIARYAGWGLKALTIKDISGRIQELRKKYRNGESISSEEIADVVFGVISLGGIETVPITMNYILFKEVGKPFLEQLFLKCEELEKEIMYKSLGGF